MKAFKIWIKYSVNAAQQALSNRMAFVIFTIGKLVRIILFLVFLNFLFSGTKTLGSYTKEQIIFFFLSFNLIDSLAQLLFRDVYRFRDMVVSGNLDLVLTKPVNPLIRVLLGGFDVFDLPILLFITLAIIYYGSQNLHPSLMSWGLYFLLILNGLIIAAAFHIIVLGFGIISTSVDHLIMVYRDLTSMLRIPADLYIEPIRFLLTFALPLGVMLTFPPKALMGILTTQFIVISVGIGLFTLFLAFKFWDYSLKQYQSASS